MSLLLAIAQPKEQVRVGGDDAPGWNYKAWKKRKEREQALEDSIRAQWQALTGNEPAPAIVEQAKAEEIRQESALEFVSYRAWDAYQFAALESILARLKAEEDDDEETLLMLM